MAGSSRRLGTGALRVAILGVSLPLLSCDGGGGGGGPVEPRDPGGAGFGAVCNIEPDYILGILARDAIPSLDEPVWKRVDQEVPDYLSPESRVIGVSGPGGAYAIPHSVLWTHEIVNASIGGEGGIAVTYCPLTGSSLVFDRTSIDGAELGVSGIIYMNNLMMYDRREPDDSLWPQMLAEARCGSRSGSKLEAFPFIEMEWASWQELHPETWALAGAELQGYDPDIVDYTLFGYPYGEYETLDVFFSEGIMPRPDDRRFAKERVIGLPARGDESGIAFPFGALEELDGAYQAVELTYEGVAATLLWSDDARGGSVFRLFTDSGTAVTLTPTDSGFLDEETGSGWTVDGRAVTGSRIGQRLEPVPDAYTAFWRAWAAFHPDTRLWEGPQ